MESVAFIYGPFKIKGVREADSKFTGSVCLHLRTAMKNKAVALQGDIGKRHS